MSRMPIAQRRVPIAEQRKPSAQTRMQQAGKSSPAEAQLDIICVKRPLNSVRGKLPLCIVHAHTRTHTYTVLLPQAAVFTYTLCTFACTCVPVFKCYSTK